MAHNETRLQLQLHLSINHFTPTVTYHKTTVIKHPVPDRVKPSFVIFDIRAL